MNTHRLFRPSVYKPDDPGRPAPKIPQDLLDYLEGRYRVEIPGPETDRDTFLKMAAKAELVRDLRKLKEGV